VILETSVLLISDGLVHPSLPARFFLRRAMRAMPGYRFRRVASLEALPELSLDSFRAMVLYVHHEAVSPSALELLEGFVGRGGGLLAVHSASASFKGEERYFDLLGGRFVEHGPVELFEVWPMAVGPHDDVFAGMPAFSVKDELYRHKYDPDNQIRFYTPIGDEREPVVWTRSHGQGRVCYCSLGHTMSSMNHPQVWQILQHGLAWVCRGEEMLA
jgi:type 1 glutamine amidotransferase